jgi:hypothetical protein
MQNRKSLLLLAAIAVLVLVFARCMNGIEKTGPRGNMYADPESCRQCHKTIYDNYIKTAHYNTTRPSSAGHIMGSFSHGKNEYVYDSLTKIIMEQKDSGLYQSLYVNGKFQEAHRFDISFGVKHAQTFLYWEGSKTFELPVSYYTSVNSWASSPGFPGTEPKFSRFVGKNCFECHSSFVDSKISEASMQFEENLERNSVVYGIDCQRCHGPAINHVNYHQAYPEVKEAKYIVTSRSLSRQQELDACAVCHSGNDKQKEISTFKFRMGDTLVNFFLPWGSRHKANSEFDVHGNQSQLLAQSKCFLSSTTLNCGTCHNAHTDAINDLAVYSGKCSSCHANPDHHTLNAEEKARLTGNCIDCHMPEQPSQAITFQLAGNPVRSAYRLRTHRIAIYPDPKKENEMRDAKNK